MSADCLIVNWARVNWAKCSPSAKQFFNVVIEEVYKRENRNMQAFLRSNLEMGTMSITPYLMEQTKSQA